MMKKTYSKLPVFLVLAWISAFVFEEVPRLILGDLPGVQQLWELGSNWFLFFLIWYGILFLIFYFAFINANIRYPIIFGILYGLIAETFLFEEMDNIFSFILFVLLYFGMFYFPFRIFKIIHFREGMSRSEQLVVISTQIMALTLLLLVARAG